jgi:hypothetical protein
MSSVLIRRYLPYLLFWLLLLAAAGAPVWLAVVLAVALAPVMELMLRWVMRGLAGEAMRELSQVDASQALTPRRADDD